MIWKAARLVPPIASAVSVSSDAPPLCTVTMCVTDFDDAMVTAAAERLAPFGDRVECRLTGLALDGVEIRVGLGGFVARFRAIA